MQQGQTPDLETAVFVHELVFCGIHGMEQDLKFQIGTEQGQGCLKEGLQFLWPVDVELGGATKQTHGADEAWQTEAMIAMGM